MLGEGFGHHVYHGCVVAVGVDSCAIREARVVGVFFQANQARNERIPGIVGAIADEEPYDRT